MLMTEIAIKYPGEKLASYKDDEGYTITIYDGVPPGEEMIWSTDNGPEGRKGTMYVTSPKGKTIQAGYWMDWSEKEWGMSDAEYGALPKKERAALEVKQQATAYRPLSDDFKSRFDDLKDKAREAKWLRRQTQKANPEVIQDH